MPFIIDIEKVKSLMIENNINRKSELLRLLIDVDHSSFWKLISNKSKNCRTSLHITVRIANALNVDIKDIIKEIK